MAFEMVGVVGLGTMGAGIAEVFARAGSRVIGVEADAEALARGRGHVEGSTRRAVDAGRLTAARRDEILGRVTLTTSRDDLRDADLVVEAVPEILDVKVSLFRDLDRICKPGAVLATNTSSLSVTSLAAATGRPDRVVGLHFFNPAPVMKLVELIPSLTTGPETTARMRAFVTDDLGKEPIEATDRAGFVVNSLLVPYLLSAIRMYEAGYASAADIDRGMMLGCGHPMGPLALSDLIGLDTVRAIGISMYDEFKEPLYSPPPLLDRMVDAGLLGKKTRQGFYPYN
jgi:3-hydroxybutyryl-CoA dehydrogenase